MQDIIVEKQNGVTYIRLNRPTVYNSFNRNMALEVQSALDECQHDATVRCVVLTGNGKAFSAGQDLNEVVAPDGPSLPTILREHYNPIISKIRSLQKPVVAAVNGVAAGAGANIALSCDITIAATSASFIQAFSKIGLIPDSGGTYFLPRLIGLQRATALAMLGEKIIANDAVSMGLIFKAVPDDMLHAQVAQLAEQLAQMPTKALWYTKHAINQSLYNNLDQQLAVEDELQYAAGLTHDYHEGVQAFLEKRKPVFVRN